MICESIRIVIAVPDASKFVELKIIGADAAIFSTYPDIAFVVFLKGQYIIMTQRIGVGRVVEVIDKAVGGFIV